MEAAKKILKDRKGLDKQITKKQKPARQAPSKQANDPMATSYCQDTKLEVVDLNQAQYRIPELPIRQPGSMEGPAKRPNPAPVTAASPLPPNVPAPAPPRQPATLAWGDSSPTTYVTNLSAVPSVPHLAHALSPTLATNTPIPTTPTTPVLTPSPAPPSVSPNTATNIATAAAANAGTNHVHHPKPAVPAMIISRGPPPPLMQETGASYHQQIVQADVSEPDQHLQLSQPVEVPEEARKWMHDFGECINKYLVQFPELGLLLSEIIAFEKAEGFLMNVSK